MLHIVDSKRTELTTTEPVTLAEAKEALQITSTDFDTKLTRLITQCRKSVEEATALSLIYKRVVLICDINEEWELPYGPVIGIEDVSTRETSVGSGMPTFTTLEEGWEVDGSEFMKIYSASPNRHKLTYTVGYTSVPADLKLALLSEIAYRFAHVGDEENQGLGSSTRELIKPHIRVIWS